MATAVSSVSSAAVAVQPSDTTATRQTNSTGSDPFQTILAAASPQSAQAAREVNQAAFNAETAAQDELDRRDAAQAADAQTTDAAAALLAAQLGVTQLATANTPLNTTGQLATDALRATTPQTTAELLGPPTQTNPLFRQAVAEAGRQNNTALPGSVTQTTPPADAVPNPTTATTTPTAAQPVSTALQTQPATTTAQPPATATTGLASAVAAVQPGQRQVVPVVTANPGQTPPAPNATDALPTPVVAPQAPAEAPAVPNASVGDRPGTAGDRFAAIASAASALPPTQAQVTTAPTAFAQALTNTTLANGAAGVTATSAAAVNAQNTANLVPAQLAAPNERRQEPGDARDATQTAALPPTFSTAPAPNSVTAAQTPTAVRTPDPVAQVADGIITHAHVATRAGETEFRMRLDPPELGPVKIKLTSDGDSIHGQVVVSNDAIRRMIESQLPELRQRLDAAGVTVQNLDVSTDANSGAGAGAGNTWGGYRSEFPADPALPSANPIAARPRAARAAGAIDVMA